MSTSEQMANSLDDPISDIQEAANSFCLAKPQFPNSLLLIFYNTSIDKMMQKQVRLHNDSSAHLVSQPILQHRLNA